MNIEKRYNTYYVTDEDVDKPIKLPSQLFPIKTTPICHFFQSNTVDCDDETMLVAYDNVEPLIGQCYTNTKKLIDTAVTAGIPKNKIVPYVGWVFTSGIYPIHHCFAVYNGESVFDFISDIKLRDIEAMENMSLDDARMQMAKVNWRGTISISERLVRRKPDLKSLLNYKNRIPIIPAIAVAATCLGRLKHNNLFLTHYVKNSLTKEKICFHLQKLTETFLLRTTLTKP